MLQDFLFFPLSFKNQKRPYILKLNLTLNAIENPINELKYITSDPKRNLFKSVQNNKRKSRRIKKVGTDRSRTVGKRKIRHKERGIFRLFRFNNTLSFVLE